MLITGEFVECLNDNGKLVRILSHQLHLEPYAECTKWAAKYRASILSTSFVNCNVFCVSQTCLVSRVIHDILLRVLWHSYSATGGGFPATPHLLWAPGLSHEWGTCTTRGQKQEKCSDLKLSSLKPHPAKNVSFDILRIPMKCSTINHRI